MFRYSIFESLNLSSFNTKNVKDMGYLFADSNNLKSIEYGNSFDTSQVTDFSAYF